MRVVLEAFDGVLQMIFKKPFTTNSIVQIEGFLLKFLMATLYPLLGN
jgi:hypothetical protein